MGSQQLGGSTAAATERPQRTPLLPTGRSTLQVYRMIKRSETACHDLLMEGDAALRSADIAVRLGIDLFPSPLKKKKENQKMPIFETTMSNKWIGSEAKSFDEYIGLLEKHVKMLKKIGTQG